MSLIDLRRQGPRDGSRRTQFGQHRCGSLRLRELGQDILNQVPCFVAVEAAGAAAGRSWGRGFLVDASNRRDDTLIDVERLVGDQHSGINGAAWMIRSEQIVRLTTVGTKHELLAIREKLRVRNPQDKLVNSWLARDHVETLGVRFSLRLRPGAAMVGTYNK